MRSVPLADRSDVPDLTVVSPAVATRDPSGLNATE
jgi:hypothetical protein